MLIYDPKKNIYYPPEEEIEKFKRIAEWAEALKSKLETEAEGTRPHPNGRRPKLS